MTKATITPMAPCDGCIPHSVFQTLKVDILKTPMIDDGMVIYAKRAEDDGSGDHVEVTYRIGIADSEALNDENGILLMHGKEQLRTVIEHMERLAKSMRAWL